MGAERNLLGAILHQNTSILQIGRVGRNPLVAGTERTVRLCAASTAETAPNKGEFSVKFFGEDAATTKLQLPLNAQTRGISTVLIEGNAHPQHAALEVL